MHSNLLTVILTLFSLLSVAFSAPTDHEVALEKRQSVAFTDPRDKGGRMLNWSGGGDLGEPLNVIISGLSSPQVLTNDGFKRYFRSLNYSIECLGLHGGAAQQADLGDGKGRRNETLIIRENFGGQLLGTCLQSLIGGNHFRAYRQENTGAFFIAASKEKPLKDSHDIVADGYNIGRDILVKEATETATTDFLGTKYKTSVLMLPGLLTPGSQNINHGISVDGLVALFTVKIV